MFVLNDDVKLAELGGGVSRKVLAYSEELMSVEVRFEKGAVGATLSGILSPISPRVFSA